MFMMGKARRIWDEEGMRSGEMVPGGLRWCLVVGSMRARALDSMVGLWGGLL